MPFLGLCGPLSATFSGPSLTSDYVTSFCYRMNWTGGGLSRSRFAKGSLTAKQKSYFAKARAKLQHSRSPPPEIQFFEFGEWMPERKAVEFSPQYAIERDSSPKQKTLDQFESTKPLVKKLESLKERREPQKRKRNPLKEVRNQAGSERPTLLTTEPIIIGSSPSASFASSRDSPAATYRPPHSSSSDDILNAPSIETKRRRLLEMDDWMGLDRPAMKPVKMRFADPADSDLIGKRRRISKINCRHSSDRRRPIARRAIPVQRNLGASKAMGLYYPEGDISVRIGSAVDRSDGRVSLRENSRRSVLSDELLDGEVIQSAHKPQPSVPVFNTPGPAPIRLSRHGNREILTPSAYMTDSSSAARASDWGDHLRQHQFTPSPVKDADNFTSRGVDELHEWALPFEEHEQAHEEPSFRLGLQDTPRPLAQMVKRRGSSPIVPDFDLAEARTPSHPGVHPAVSKALESATWDQVGTRNVRYPKYAERDDDKSRTHRKVDDLYDVVPQLVSAASKSFQSANVDNGQIHSDPGVETLAIPTPPSALASAQILTEFQECIASNARLEDGITRTLHHMEKRFARETGRVLPSTTRRRDPQPIDGHEQQHHDQSQTTSEAKASMRDLTGPCSAKGKTAVLQAPLAAATNTKVQERPAEPSATNKDEKHIPLSATKEQAVLNAAEDEEAAWRKIVFGDDLDRNDQVFEEPDPHSQSSLSPHHTLLTQPSLLAEAATSPLKQNPHLADSIFDAPTSTLPYRSPTQKYTANSPAQEYTTTTSPLPPTPIQPKLPRTLVQNPVPSSLLGEASSVSQQEQTLSNLSSGELHWPPERFPANRNNLQKLGGNLPQEKTIFKKPKRYIGLHSSDPAAPVNLGRRVLRNGRRIGHTDEKGAEGKRKGRRKTRGRSGQVEQEYEDEQDMFEEDDDIVDN